MRIDEIKDIYSSVINICEFFICEMNFYEISVISIRFSYCIYIYQ